MFDSLNEIIAGRKKHDQEMENLREQEAEIKTNNYIESNKRVDFYLNQELEYLGVNLYPVSFISDIISYSENILICEERNGSPCFKAIPKTNSGITYHYVDNNGVIQTISYTLSQLQRILPYEDKE